MRIIRNATFRILPPQPGSPLSCVRRAGEKQVARISKWWEDFEPNDTVPMPAGSFIRRVAAYTMLQNLTGWPATVVRGGTSREGLPLGLQISTHYWREDVSLAIARPGECCAAEKGDELAS